MSRQEISLMGAIGTVKTGTGVVHGITLSSVIAKVAALPEGTTELVINIMGPGGVKETGDYIYNFLMSLKPEMRIIMNQVGDIGSIMSKIWFAGDERIALKGINPDTGKPYEIFIHNPWMRVEGDAATMQAAINAVKPQEEELAKFYADHTGIPLEGISPMMAQQTGIDAEQPVAMKFATTFRESLSIAAFDMKFKKEDEQKLESVLDKVLNYFKSAVKAETPPAPPVAAAPAPPAAPAPETTPMIGKSPMVDGVALPDGEYYVKGGLIVSVSPLVAEGEMPAAMAANIAALETLLEEQAKKSVKTEAEILAMVNAEVAKQVEAFKATFKTTHVPKYKEVILASDRRETPVQARNRENMERQEAERKKV